LISYSFQSFPRIFLIALLPFHFFIIHRIREITDALWSSSSVKSGILTSLFRGGRSSKVVEKVLPFSDALDQQQHNNSTVTAPNTDTDPLSPTLSPLSSALPLDHGCLTFDLDLWQRSLAQLQPRLYKYTNTSTNSTSTSSSSGSSAINSNSKTNTNVFLASHGDGAKSKGKSPGRKGSTSTSTSSTSAARSSSPTADNTTNNSASTSSTSFENLTTALQWANVIKNHLSYVFETHGAVQFSPSLLQLKTSPTVQLLLGAGSTGASNGVSSGHSNRASHNGASEAKNVDSDAAAGLGAGMGMGMGIGMGTDSKSGGGSGKTKSGSVNDSGSSPSLATAAAAVGSDVNSINISTIEDSANASQSQSTQSPPFLSPPALGRRVAGPAELMDSSGQLVVLPSDLVSPYARYVALLDIKSSQRYCIEKVRACVFMCVSVGGRLFPFISISFLLFPSVFPTQPTYFHSCLTACAH
jgi:hypothetical protein